MHSRTVTLAQLSLTPERSPDPDFHAIYDFGLNKLAAWPGFRIQMPVKMPKWIFATIFVFTPPNKKSVEFSVSQIDYHFGKLQIAETHGNLKLRKYCFNYIYDIKSTVNSYEVYKLFFINKYLTS